MITKTSKDINILLSNQKIAIENWDVKFDELKPLAQTACETMIHNVFDDADFDWVSIDRPTFQHRADVLWVHTRKMHGLHTRKANSLDHFFKVFEDPISKFIEDYSNVLNYHIRLTYCNAAHFTKDEIYAVYVPYSGFNFWSKESIAKFYPDGNAMPNDSIYGAMTRGRLIQR